MHTDFTRYVVVSPIYVATSAKTLLRQCHAYGPCCWWVIGLRVNQLMSERFKMMNSGRCCVTVDEAVKCISNLKRHILTIPVVNIWYMVVLNWMFICLCCLILWCIIALFQVISVMVLYSQFLRINMVMQLILTCTVVLFISSHFKGIRVHLAAIVWWFSY